MKRAGFKLFGGGGQVNEKNIVPLSAERQRGDPSPKRQRGDTSPKERRSTGVSPVGPQRQRGDAIKACQLVVAPSEAERTQRAYLASTPRATRGGGATQAARRRAISASSRVTSSR